MPKIADNPDETTRLEQKIAIEKNPNDKLGLMDQYIALMIFKDVERAKILLTHQEQLLQQTPNNRILIHFLTHKAFVENQLYNYSASLDAYELAIREALKMNEKSQIVTIYIDASGTLINQNNFEKAEQYLEKAHKINAEITEDNTLLSARLKCREGFVQLHYENYPRAIELLLDAEKLITEYDKPLKIKDYYFLTLVQSGLGRVYERGDDFEKSVRSYLTVANMCESIGIRSRLSWHYLNVGNSFMAMGDLESAEEYYKRANQTEEDSRFSARASANANLGYIAYIQENFETALDYFDRSEELFKNRTDGTEATNITSLETYRGQLYMAAGKEKLALQHFAKAFEQAKVRNDKRQLVVICKHIADFHASEGDFKNAYEYQLLYEKISERHHEEISKRKVLELEARFSSEKKKRETEMLRLQATSLQLKALRAQMNPHFIYNALNSIQQFITSNNAADAAKYLAKFAKLMRQSLEYSDMEMLDLEKEIEFLTDYLTINQKLRFEDNLQFTIEVDEKLDDDFVAVPTMIVQPYVENAIEHGLRGRKDGKILVQFLYHNEKSLICVVEDNGVGREKVRLHQDQIGYHETHRSRGTTITEQRLSLLLGNEQGGNYIQTFDLKSKITGEAEGTRVEILIPFMEMSI